MFSPRLNSPNLTINTRGIGGIASIFNSASFDLRFADLGAGVVDIVPSRGGVTGTFTRATAAYTVLSSGLLSPVATGVARAYYDPTSLAYLGYLAEGARTNLLIRSEEFDSGAWAKTDTTVIANDTTSPDGTASADRLTEGVAGTASVFQAITIVADATTTLSRFMKFNALAPNVMLTMFETADSANFVRGWFNIQTGVAGSVSNGGTGSGATVRIKAYPNGWYRCELTGAVGNAATAVSTITQSADADASTARVNNSVRWEWGAQAEAAAFSSSYIQTITVAVTRNADVPTYPLTGWYNSATGTAFVQANLGGNVTAATKYLWSLDDTTANNVIAYRDVITEARSSGIIINSGSGTVDLNSGTWEVNTTSKAATAWALNDVAESFNGGAVAIDTSSAIPTVTQLSVGHLLGSQVYGTISRIAYWPRRLPNSVLQAVTA